MSNLCRSEAVGHIRHAQPAGSAVTCMFNLLQQAFELRQPPNGTKLTEMMLPSLRLASTRVPIRLTQPCL